jgi:glycine hydroxymethyltransferase
MHVIAAKAVRIRRGADARLQDLQERVLENARVLAKVLQERGCASCRRHRLAHVPRRPARQAHHGKDAEAALARAHITVNKNAIPNDPEKPFVTSGIRIGSPAVHDARLRRARVRGARAPDRRRARRPADDGGLAAHAPLSRR